MSKMPEALLMAGRLLEAERYTQGARVATQVAAAAELRRLHAVNAELLEALKRVKETRVFIGAIAQGMMDNAIARAAPEVQP